MFSPCLLKTLNPLQVFSVKSSPSSSLSSMKLKNLIHTLIFSHMCRIKCALSKVKTIFIEILKDKKSKRRKKIIMGSFRLHYNWHSSKSFHHFLPDSATSYLYYDSNWNTTTTSVIIPAEQEVASGEDLSESQLAGYLLWLEEENVDDGGSNISTTKEKETNHEIDMLAEMFITNCHDKFRLEKQESDRKFQEMLARSL